MSEYQYYEFQAIDRPLSEVEMKELRALSTRAEITATSFQNEYSYGDFKGDPVKLMHRYFDAFVYVANWGNNTLMFKIPRRFLDEATVSPYGNDETLSIVPGDDHLLLTFSLGDEEPDDGWVQGEPWMPALITLRADLMRGDYRALYLGWLAGIPTRDEEDEDEQEPPVPPGLAKLSAPLRSLADFLDIEDELIEAAARGSTGEPPAEPTKEELAGWVKRLPAADKDDVLVRFLSEEGDLILRAELLRRFREATAPKGRKPDETRRRTIGELCAARDALVEEKNRELAERRAREKAEKDRKDAELRAKRLEMLSKRQPETWKSIDEHIKRKTPTAYDEAVRLLVDLSDLAKHSGTESEFVHRVRELRERHSNKPSFLKRLKAKGFS
jgi:hypothetical protein